MPTQLVCPLPGCGKALMVADADLSRALRCPHCRQVFDLSSATLTVPPVLPTLAGQTPVVAARTLTDPGTPVDLIPPTEPVRIGRFDIRERLGEGAFGVVYRAWDTQLEREVALKVAKPHALNTEARVKRFLREARAAAQLRHPNIVPVHDSGRDGEQYYFASAFIAGQSLAAVLLEQPNGLGVRRAAAIMRRLAEALAYAHSKNIIHRDVKPANAMLDEQGEPMLLDFGLAARADGEERLTQEAATMGTPAYMAPEQAAGQAQAASDQYSLGCTFYELLTGQTPFSGPPELQIFLHQSQEPLSPRMVNKALPRDLETICLKCLARNPAERYPDCTALADDLRRWLEGEPIQARRLTLMERFGKLARRRPALVAAWGLTGLAAGLIGFAVIVTRMWQSSEFQRGEAESAQRRAEAAQSLAEQERGKARDAAELAQEERAKAREAERLAQVSEKAARAAEERTAQIKYLHQVDLAYRDWQDNNLVRARDLLHDCDPGAGQRPWEWRYVQHLCHTAQDLRGHTDSVIVAIFTPNGRRIVSGGLDGSVKVWDIQTGKEVLSWRAHQRIVYALAFSPDGQRLVSGGGDNLAKVWDVATGKELLTLQRHPAAVQSVAFRPDGKRIVSVSQGGLVKIWDAQNGQEVQSFETQAPLARGVAFTPDGKRLLSGSGKEGFLAMWDPETGKELVSIKDPISGFLHADLSADGKRIVTCDGHGMVKLWDAGTGQALRSWLGHSPPVWSVAFSPDGRWVASCGVDNLVKVWDAGTGQAVLTLKGHADAPGSVAFSPDSQRLVSTGKDKIVKVWSIQAGQEASRLKGHQWSVYAIAFRPDSARLASASVDSTLRIWDVQTGEQVFLLQGHTGAVMATAFSNDGKRLVSASRPLMDKKPGEVKVWDAEKGKELLDLKGHAVPVAALAFSRDDKRIHGGSEDGTLLVWDAATGKALPPFPSRHFGAIRALAVSPDGKRLATAGQDNTVRIWDAQEGKELLVLRAHVGEVVSVAFNKEGTRLVSGGFDGTVRIWDPLGKAEQTPLTFKAHAEPVASVAYSRDGKRIISAGWDKTVKLLDIQTGQEALSLKPGGDRVFCVAISPDDAILAAGCVDSTLKLWNGR